MAFSKKIVTPAGNVLGDYGVLVGIVAQQTQGGLLANSCAIALYASRETADADKPNVAMYRYPLNNVPYDPKDLAPVIDVILKTKDSGIYDGNRQDRQAWQPGWEGAELVDNPKGVGL